MDRYLITPSLHGAYRYHMDSEDGEKNELLNSLNKVPFAKSEAMQKGINFENDVIARCAGQSISNTDESWAKCVDETADYVRGALQQERVLSHCIINDIPVLLYGKADFINRDRGYDTKFTGVYEVGKFTKPIQHAVYMACSGLPNFSYLITDGRSLWKEDYSLTLGMIQNMVAEVAEMLTVFQRDSELWTAFTSNWKSYDSAPVDNIGNTLKLYGWDKEWPQYGA
jgi:hypothetical protein